MHRGMFQLTAQEKKVLLDSLQSSAATSSAALLQKITASLAEPATTYQVNEHEIEELLDLLPPPQADSDPSFLSLRQKIADFLLHLRGR